MRTMIHRNIALFVVAIVAFIGMMATIVDAKNNDCQNIAEEHAQSLHTDIVWIQYIDSNGAYIFDGKNGAHIINSKVIQGKRYYFDFSIQAYDSRIFNSKEEVSIFYKSVTGYDNEVYIVGLDNIPFNIQW